jgi:outer membrane lipoprotein-sorting protein
MTTMRLRILSRCTVLILLTLLAADRLLAAGDLPEVLRDLEAQCESRHAALQDLTIITDFIIHSPDGDARSMHVIREKGNHIRLDVYRSGAAVNNSEQRLDFVGISDDKSSWTITRAGERHAEGSAVNQQDPNFLCWQFTPETTSMDGEDTVRGKECYMVDVQVRHTTNRLWIDKDTHFVLQHDEISASGKTTRWVASNFNTATGDLKIPQKTDMYIGDHLMATVIVQSVTFNTGLTDDVFDPDKVKLDSSK